ncbi:MAG: DNA mismatch repair protein MutS [Candidatus Latescibacteria bacterium]|nr:DNA mismatch repair protein MutS [Candidatus Latescibacterota bacterium]
MIEQYWKLKEQYPNTLLFFRMGDFYEMFFEDAKIASQLLGLTLTSRNHGKTQDVPLAGIPWHALESYLPKLIRAGKRVAICEQMEDAKKAKKLLKRDVVEVVTPGTALSESLLDQKRNNYLLAFSTGEAMTGVVVVDLSTGEFSVTEVRSDRLMEEIERACPSEVLASTTWGERFETMFKERFPGVLLTTMDGWVFRRETAYETLISHFGVTSLKGFDCEDLNEGICAAGAALKYLKDNQKAALTHISQILRYRPTDILVLDSTTQRNLEITTSLRGEGREGTLLAVIDRTETAMGGRMLRQWLTNPLRDVVAILQRLDAVEELVQKSSIRKDLSDSLKSIGDVERMTAKICCGRATPKDLVGLKESLRWVPRVKETVEEVPSDLIKKAMTIPDVSETVRLIDEAIVDQPPYLVTEGGIIRDGYDAELDDLRKGVAEGKAWIAKLQTQERARTGISSLKVGYNRAFGYYIEVTKSHLSKVPPDYMTRQTMVGASRFITPELKEWEAKILGADERIKELERDLFAMIRSRVAERAADLQTVARGIATIDVVAALAETAVAYDYVRPEVDEGDVIEIKGGRHPVVERLLRDGEFVENDLYCDRSGDQILIITGPNMAGKSTYLRQVGLIVLLAQAGGFVPAKSVRIGLVDRIFTRVGASDNLARGESTFLVEMNEAANILNNATDRSLILLDEVGRGTSTFDGLSIAWAMTEYLHNGKRQPKTLFATHYHELTDLADQLPRVKNYNVAVRERGDQVIFLRKIVPGGTDRSYGIHVARLAGLPQEVIERAKEILRVLEKQEEVFGQVSRRRGRPGRRLPVEDFQINLFEQPQGQDDAQEDPVLQEIRAFDVASTTPLQALMKINEWKQLIEKRE